VPGKVLYNSKPVENIEVKLCETFSQFLGGCSGKTYTARTDKGGVRHHQRGAKSVRRFVGARV
jgi:hypothetical protein